MARREQHQLLFFLTLLLLAFYVFASHASAAEAADLTDAGASLTGLLDLVKNSASQWDGKLRGYAKTLFWLLASIQLIWTFMPLVFRQADFGEIVGELIRFILVIGFFYALLLFSAEWADKVVNSFRQAGVSAAGLGSSGIRPGEIFGLGIELAKLIGDMSTWNPLTAIMIGLACVMVLMSFTFIAAFMGITIIESYLVINASVLFMGFGGSQWTREYALAIVRYAISVGAKVFVLTLIVGLIVDSAKTWQAAYQHDNASMWTMVGMALVCAYLTKTIPELVAGMISGTSMGGGSAIGGMAATAFSGAAASTKTIATAGKAALRLSGGVGGLASAINSSFAGGGSRASALTGCSGSASGLGTSTGSREATKGAKSAGARVGGGGSSAQQSPVSAQSQHGAGAAGGGSKIALGMTRAIGTLAAISVPGMESASDLSLGYGAPQPVPGADADGSMAPSSAKPSPSPSQEQEQERDSVSEKTS